MAYEQQQRGPQRGQQQELSTQDLLTALLNKPIGERFKYVDEDLRKTIPSIAEVLPSFILNGEPPERVAARLVKRAMITFARKPDLQEVPPADFKRCVLEAAELGFAIDGKMCYVVRYGGKSQSFSMQLDWKAIVAVAKRNKMITDIYTDVVCKHDRFIHRRVGKDTIFEHDYDLGSPRGDTIGAYAVIVLPSGFWRTEVMTFEELEKVRALAPAKNGPWGTWTDEMRKKTVIKRGLKPYLDDPNIALALAYDDDDYDQEDEPRPPTTFEAIDRRMQTASEPRQPAPKFGDGPPVDESEAPRDEQPRGRNETQRQEKAPLDDARELAKLEEDRKTKAAESSKAKEAEHPDKSAGDPLAGLVDKLRRCKTKREVYMLEGEYVKRLNESGEMAGNADRELASSCEQRRDEL